MITILPKQLIALYEVPLVKLPLTKVELIEKVNYYSSLNKNDPTKIIATINCENPTWDTTLQSRVINKQGEREKSYGLAQIHLPSHPNITKEQATDPDFALNYITLHLGRDDSWSCYKKNS